MLEIQNSFLREKEYITRRLDVYQGMKDAVMMIPEIKDVVKSENNVEGSTETAITRKEVAMRNIETAHTKIKDRFEKELLTLEIIKVSKLQDEESMYHQRLLECKYNAHCIESANDKHKSAVLEIQKSYLKKKEYFMGRLAAFQRMKDVVMMTPEIKVAVKGENNIQRSVEIINLKKDPITVQKENTLRNDSGISSTSDIKLHNRRQFDHNTEKYEKEVIHHVNDLISELVKSHWRIDDGDIFADRGSSHCIPLYIVPPKKTNNNNIQNKLWTHRSTVEVVRRTNSPYIYLNNTYESQVLNDTENNRKIQEITEEEEIDANIGKNKTTIDTNLSDYKTTLQNNRHLRNSSSCVIAISEECKREL